jgi:hypothetical protein
MSSGLHTERETRQFADFGPHINELATLIIETRGSFSKLYCKIMESHQSVDALQYQTPLSANRM